MSFWGSLGHGLLKVAKYAAPIALAATGVGAPFAAMAAGGLNALDTKISGGSWKDAALSGAIGGGTAMIPGIGSVAGKGISPTVSGITKGVLGNVGNDVRIGTDIAGMFAKQGQPQSTQPPQASQSPGQTLPGQASGNRGYFGGGGNTFGPNYRSPSGFVGRVGNLIGAGQNNPYADIMNLGRMQALRQQPMGFGGLGGWSGRMSQMVR
jgi:hypothetical protein